MLPDSSDGLLLAVQNPVWASVPSIATLTSPDPLFLVCLQPSAMVFPWWHVSHGVGLVVSMAYCPLCPAAPVPVNPRTHLSDPGMISSWTNLLNSELESLGIHDQASLPAPSNLGS